MITPCFDTFRQYARDGYDIVPVLRRFPFDTRTAVTAYANLKNGPFAFLLESVVGAEKWARYTFLGSAPREVVRSRGGRLEHWTARDGWQSLESDGDVLAYLDTRLKSQRIAPGPGMPRFFGGVVGYIGYDVVRTIEHLPHAPPNDLGLAEAVLMFTDVVIAIDNVFGHAMAICCVPVSAQLDDKQLRKAYDDACNAIDVAVERVLATPDVAPLQWSETAESTATPHSSFAQRDFEQAVERIRELIAAGDVFQVVLSQRLALPLTTTPLQLYRGLRALNPSPYLYLLELDDVALVGSSPEVLVRVEQERVIVRPIAGTRRRGANDEEDARLAAELQADAKERAEHLMLVDLGRNDVGRVALHGTVQVTEFMSIERYSHVLHMVSQVEGQLHPDFSVVDVLRACFPAGTVSGAPKVRAMQIIDELEPVSRGPYGGAVGYFSYGGAEMDTAIAIRTLVAAGGMAYVQAGAGVVADSDPTAEYHETLAKAQAVIRVLQTVTPFP